jgi:hypothetical protein
MVMLEKTPGVCLVDKLQVILLLEADKNCHNGEIFGQRMLNLVRDEGFIPTEQQADKQKTAEDGLFMMKVLKHDISRQKRAPFAQMSVDAANCYDRIHHLILGLMLLAMGVPIGPITAMHYIIQSMKYFLRTGYGESKSHMSGILTQQLMHGLCQGNRASTAC